MLEICMSGSMRGRELPSLPTRLFAFFVKARVMKKMLVLVFVIAAASPSCNRGATSTGTSKPTVALVLKTLNHPFFVDMRRGAQEAADRLGVNLQVQAAEREIDVEKQMQIVENLIQTGIQALCITPSGSREIVSALVKAKNANVPIVVVDGPNDLWTADFKGWWRSRDKRRCEPLTVRDSFGMYCRLSQA